MQFTAKFFDGMQARPFQVDVTVYAAEMHIRAEGAPPVVWPLAEIAVLDAYNAAHPAKLTCAAMPDARLVVDDAALWLALLPALKNARWKSSRLPVSGQSLLGFGILAVLVLVLAVVYVPRLAESLAVFVPEKTERNIGRMLLTGEFSDDLCVAPEGLAAFGKLWDRIDAGVRADIDAPRPYKPFVIDRRDANAFALPGGYIVVFSGLLTNVQSVEELAGILAHERGHIEYRHGIRGMMRYLGLATVMQAMLGNTDVITSLGVIGALQYNRADEAAADAFAIQTLQNAAIDPVRFADFFDRHMLKSGGGDGLWEYIATHPSSRSRIDAIRSVQKPQGKPLPPVMAKTEFFALQDICKKKQPMEQFLQADENGDKP